jgi:hypothetical protein
MVVESALFNHHTKMNIVSNLFNRYIWLVDLIYRMGRITFEDINSRWQHSQLSDGKPLPVRTFHRHRQDIETIFNITIACDRHTDYAYYIENQEDMQQGSIRAWLLNTFAVNNLINESHAIKHRILFEQIPSGQRHLTTIIEAMRDDMALELTYRGFENEAASTFMVEPFCIKIFRQRWYLLARSAKGLRIYALDRIENLHAVEQKFDLPQDFNAQAVFEYAYGIIIDQSLEPCRVQLKVYGIKRDYLRTLPLHASQTESAIAADHSIFTYYLKVTYDFRQELLSHGAEIEVISPPALRKEMADTAAKMSMRYLPA